ncbi:hypothetical protein GCM10011575_30750 [Microlunatus endophyticus]|uniref:Glycosyl hydrolases family 2 n=1 Tax=Microlunatus endophyticus TaxID=1716077 RepID=A0A917W6U6_9ACTN|nr:hypothetical protein GCM10011575_30750 [Microlunatus endophyticus]
MHAALSTAFVLTDSLGRFTLTDIPAAARTVHAAKEAFRFSSVSLAETVRIVISPDDPSQLPRPEYPRPDLDRRPFTDGAWACLNGTWSFDPDPKGIGETEGWFDPSHQFGQAIRLPFPVQSLASIGEEDRATDGMWVDQFAGSNGLFWYRRSFTVPESFAGRNTRLRIGAVNWSATVWLDGIKMATDLGSGYSEVLVDLGRLAAGSTHTLAIKVFTPPGNHTAPYPMGKQMGWFSAMGGIWQSVWIEPVDAVRLSEVRAVPKLTFAGSTTTVIAASFQVAATITGTDSAAVTARLIGPDGDHVLSASLPVTDGSVSAVLDVPDPKLWAPESPQLYRLLLGVDAADDGTDGAALYLGLREFRRDWAPGHGPDDTADVHDQYQHFYLNNRPYFVRAVLDQGYTPWGIYTYPGVNTGPDFRTGTDTHPQPGSIRHDVAAIKQLGFNTTRMHVKINDPWYYHLCDQLGLLVWYDMPNNPYNALGDDAHANWEKNTRAAIARDANHPSIVTWVTFNEGWGIGGGGALDPDQYSWVLAMVAMIRDLDPNRLVVDNSPVLVQGHLGGDINDFHWYSGIREQWKTMLDQQSSQVYPGSTWNFLDSKAQSGQPWMNAEFGNGPDKFVMHVGLFRSYAKMSGYVYTEIAAEEHERGLPFTYCRLPTETGYLDHTGALRGIELFNTDDVVCLDSDPGIQLAPGSPLSVPVSISHFSSRDLSAARLRWQVVGTDAAGREKKTTVGGSRVVNAEPFTVTEVGSVTIAAPKDLRVARLYVWLEDHGESIAESQIVVDQSSVGTSIQLTGATLFDVAKPSDASWSGGTVGIIDEAGTTGTYTGVGFGWSEYQVDVPANCRTGRDASLICELATYADMTTELAGQSQELVKNAGTGMTTCKSSPHPATIAVSVDGVVAGSIHIPDDPADARGRVGSWRAPGQIRYGYPVSVRIPGRYLSGKQQVTLRLASLAGLSLFGPGTGRYGIDAQLVPAMQLAIPKTIRPGQLPTFALRPTITIAAPDLSTGAAGVAVVSIANPTVHTMSAVQVSLISANGGTSTALDAPMLSKLKPGASAQIRFSVDAGPVGVAQMLQLTAIVDATVGSRRVTNRIDAGAQVGGAVDLDQFPTVDVDDDFATDTSANYDLWLPVPATETMPATSSGGGELAATKSSAFYVLAANKAAASGKQTLTTIDIKQFIVPRVKQDVFFVGLAKDAGDYVLAWMGYQLASCGIDIRVGGTLTALTFPNPPIAVPGDEMALMTVGNDVSLWLNHDDAWTPIAGTDVSHLVNLADSTVISQYRHAVGFRGQGGTLAVSHLIGRSG